MNLKQLIKRLAKKTLQRSYWYNNELFPDCEKFWTYSTFNTEVVNLGSTSGLYAFDYKGLPFKAANWALRHNPLLGDLSILKNYSSYLTPSKSTVILPLCPFSSLAGRYESLEDHYYTILYPTTIPSFSYQREQKIISVKQNPFLYYPAVAVFKDFVMLFKPHTKQLRTEAQMEKDAQSWINNWMKEFSLKDLISPLSLLNKDAIEDAAHSINQMIEYCASHNIRLAIVIPPMYHTLSTKFTPEFREKIIGQLISKLNDRSLFVHNYMDDDAFNNRIELFYNSYYLNVEGARLFTKRVLTDLGLLKS